MVSNTGCSFTDMDSIPSNHMEASNHLKLGSGDPMAYSDSVHPRHAFGVQTYMQIKYPCTLNLKKKYLKKERGLPNFWF